MCMVKSDDELMGTIIAYAYKVYQYREFHFIFSLLIDVHHINYIYMLQ